jgi:hypothetical protein
MMIGVMDDSFEGLIAAGAAADVTGWDFSWLEGRATEERPPWGYQNLMGEKIGRSVMALDIQTGCGEVLAGVPQRAAKAMVATESWPPPALPDRGPQAVAGVAGASDPGQAISW